MLLVVFLGSLATMLLIYYHWSRRHLYILSWKLPGPFAHPLVGNSLTFIGPTEDLLTKIRCIASQYKQPLRLWLGPELLVYFSSAHHVEKILTSMKLLRKHRIYDFTKPVVGDGLISNSGHKWKMHRKIIQPLFSIDYVNQSAETISRHLEKCVAKLREHTNGTTFNIVEVVHPCIGGIIMEVLTGESFDVQSNQMFKDFYDAATECYEVIFARIMKPWLHPQPLLDLSEVGLKIAHIERVISKMFQYIVDKRRALPEQSQTDSLIIDKLMSSGTFSDAELRDHLMTLYLASEDTIASVVSMAGVCFGMYPEYQRKAYEEVQSICQNHRSISISDLPQLKYLDMCIKDILRLTPIAPYIIRQPDEPFEIDGLTIPRDCGVLVSIMDAHYDPSHWANPDHFHPDHFSPEAVEGRHPYAYVPFSAGPRGCIGRVFANACLKVILAEMLRNFEFEADGKFPDLKLSTDISVRPVDGYMVRLKRRC